MSSYVDRITGCRNASELIALVDEFITSTREQGGFENLPPAARPRRLYNFRGLVHSREALANVVEREPKGATHAGALAALIVLDAALSRFRVLVEEFGVPVEHWRMG